MCGETKLLIQTEPDEAATVAWKLRGLAATLGLGARHLYDPTKGEVEVEFWALLDPKTGVELSCFCFYDECPDLQNALRTFLWQALAGTTGRAIYYANIEWCDDTNPPQPLSLDEALSKYPPGADCCPPVLLTRDGIAYKPLPDADGSATSVSPEESSAPRDLTPLETVLDFGGPPS